MRQRHLATAVAAISLVSAPAFAQAVSGNTNLLGKAPPSSVNIPASAVKPAGTAAVKAGETVAVVSGAHNTGPAPIVTGAVPQTEGFADGVTDGTEKLGHGAKTTGKAIERGGVTVDAKGAQTGVTGSPGRATTQAKRATAVVVPK